MWTGGGGWRMCPHSPVPANEIGDEGAVSLASLLVTNTTLTALDVSGNAVREEGTEALAAALSCNRVLTDLNLSCTPPRAYPAMLCLLYLLLCPATAVPHSQAVLRVVVPGGWRLQTTESVRRACLPWPTCLP
jgi:hypothetical protein